MLSRALKMGVCFNWGPILGNMVGTLFPRDLERRVRFFYQKSSLQRGPIGKPGGGLIYWGL